MYICWRVPVSSCCINMETGHMLTNQETDYTSSVCIIGAEISSEHIFAKIKQFSSNKNVM